MKIIVNGLQLLFPLTGVGQYIRQLFGTLADMPDMNVRFFYGGKLDTALRVPPPANHGGIQRIYHAARSFIPGVRHVKQGIAAAAFRLHTRNLDGCIYHEPNFLPLPFRGPSVLTIFDLSCFDLPETHPRERVSLMEKHLPPAIERAAHLIVCSEHTRNVLLKRFGVAPQRISVTPLAAAGQFHPRPAASIAPLLSAVKLHAGGYTLSVGTLEPRKNLASLFSAYETLPASLRTRYPLIVAGMSGWHMEHLSRATKKLIDQGALRLLGHVPDELLPVLYAGARLFVYPSRYEGFGLPPLEAMATGIPVVTGNRTSLPEVVGEAGLMVDPDDVEGFARAIRLLLEDSNAAQRYGEAGRQRASRFSWARCAQETLEAYKKVGRENGL